MPAAAKPASFNTDPFLFALDGEKYLGRVSTTASTAETVGAYEIPSFGSLTAGQLRKVRKLDEVSQMFTLVEDVVDGDTLDALDALSIPSIASFFADWQQAAGVDLPS